MCGGWLSVEHRDQVGDDVGRGLHLAYLADACPGIERHCLGVALDVAARGRDAEARDRQPCMGLGDLTDDLTIETLGSDDRAHEHAMRRRRW